MALFLAEVYAFALAEAEFGEIILWLFLVEFIPFCRAVTYLYSMSQVVLQSQACGGQWWRSG